MWAPLVNEGAWAEQQQEAAESKRHFSMMAEQQRATLNQVMVEQATANQQLWDGMAQLLITQTTKQTSEAGAHGGVLSPNPSMRIPKMTKDEYSESFLNTFEPMATVAGITLGCGDQALADWICSTGLAIPSVTDLGDYKKVRAAILQTLNLNMEAYRRRLREIECGPEYHPPTDQSADLGPLFKVAPPRDAV